MLIYIVWVVANAIEASKLYKNVFDGKVFDTFQFPNRPKSNEASVTIGNITLS